MSEKNVSYYLALPYSITLSYQDGEWLAEIPDLPGCIAAGDTKEEALRLIDDAQETWISNSFELGYPIPEPERQPA